jgi:peroxiredoxin
MKNTITLLLLLALAPAFAQERSKTIAALDFTARDLDGKKIQLKNILAKGPVLLDFWALWCVPCLKEMPELQKIFTAYHKRGLTIIAVNEDAASGQSQVRPFIKQKRFDFLVVLDEDKDLWNQFNVTALPTTLLLDRNGAIVYSHAGYKPGDEAELKKAIDKLFEAANGERQ